MLDTLCFSLYLLLLDIKLCRVLICQHLADCTRAWVLSGGVKSHVSSGSSYFPQLAGNLVM